MPHFGTNPNELKVGYLNIWVEIESFFDMCVICEGWIDQTNIEELSKKNTTLMKIWLAQPGFDESRISSPTRWCGT